jgi:hypothetical protein
MIRSIGDADVIRRGDTTDMIRRRDWGHGHDPEHRGVIRGIGDMDTLIHTSETRT